MAKTKILSIVKVCIPILLILLAAVVTICINLAVKVYPAKYYNGENYIDFTTAHTYSTKADTGLYNFNESEKIVTLSNGSELEYESPYILKSSTGETYISPSMIAWQVFGGLLYVGAAAYMCVVYKIK